MAEKIYVIGDSHVNFFSGNDEIGFVPYLKGIHKCRDKLKCFRTFHVGPILAYNLNAYNTSTGGRELIERLIARGDLPKGAYVMCCFGEVDLRCHVMKQAQLQNVSFKKVVDDIIVEYVTFLKRMQSLGYRMICWGPVSSSKDEWTENPKYPRSGTESERNEATLYFNRRLEEECSRIGAHFVSVIDDLLDENYKTKEMYISYGCHLNQKAMELARHKFGFVTKDAAEKYFYYWKHLIFSLRRALRYNRSLIRFICCFVPVKKWRHRIRAMSLQDS